MAASQLFDLHAAMENYAWQNYQDMEHMKKIKSEFRGLDREDVSFEINTKRLIVQHSEPEYNHLAPTGAGAKPYTLFKTVFTNSTGRDQEYSFKTERTTESVALICREKGFTIGEEAELGLKTPGEILEFKAGFKHELHFNKASENSVSEMLSWGVDSNIIVPRHYKTTAQLIVEEMSYSGNFNVNSVLSGRITVVLRRRRDGALILPVTANICEVMRELLSSPNAPKELKNMCTIEKNDCVKLETKGSCNFQFATKQHIKLMENPLTDHDLKFIED